ncbi:MAG: PEP-utilizing enzyme [Candidatus Daviesbacteria bacterium]
MNQKDYLAEILTAVYLFDIPKIQNSINDAWEEYQRLLTEAEKTKDLGTITKTRAYLYFLGNFLVEDFAQGAIERRLDGFEPKVKLEDFVNWVDSENVPSKYQKDELFQNILKFYQIIKDLKNKDVNGSYLDEDRFNKIYAEILGKQVSEVYIWDQKKRVLKEEMEGKEMEKEFKGMIASEGKVEGKAFVIEGKEDIENFEEGAILVASITTPEFLPAMKKALAIATDFGGIMSHPAIIARELKLPCVVGAKGISLAIKTGDLIELDASKGVVKILS